MRKSFKSIGDYSKMVGVSPEFLKFYEKKDLVKPVWKDDRAYRYYADYQITHFIEYQQLSKMGVSLENAREVIKSANLNDRLDIYKNAYKEKKAQLEEMIILLKQFEDTIDGLDKIKNQSNWRIEFLPESHFVYFDVENPKDTRNNPIWKDFFSMNVTQQVILKNKDDYELKDGSFTRIWGAIHPMISDDIKKEPTSRCIPVGNCNCFVYEYSIPTDYDDEGKLSDKVWDLSAPFKILKDNGIKHKGEIYQKRFCVTHEDHGEFLHVQTIIPLPENF